MPPLQLLPVISMWLRVFAVFMFSKSLTQVTVHSKFQQIQQLWPSNHKHDPPRSRSAMVRSTPGSDHRAAEVRERVVGEADTRESKYSEAIITLLSKFYNCYCYTSCHFQVIFIDNWRVMHGREAFTGLRQLCGCYLTRDDVLSAARCFGLQAWTWHQVLCIFVLSHRKVDAILDHAPLNGLDEAVFLFIRLGFVPWSTEAVKYGYHGETAWSCLGSTRAPPSGDRRNWPSGISQLPEALRVFRVWTQAGWSLHQQFTQSLLLLMHMWRLSNIILIVLHFDWKNISNSSTKLYSSQLNHICHIVKMIQTRVFTVWFQMQI